MGARRVNDLDREPGVGAIPIEETTLLEAHVRCRLGGRLYDLRLVRIDRGLVLRGRAPTFYAKQLAQHAVMEASGLPILANEMEVA